MASDAVIQFSFAGLPESYCFTGFDRLALDIANGLSGFVPGEYSVIIKQESEPNAVDRSKDWHKLLPGGAPTGRLYTYYFGKWVSPHPKEPGGSERMWWDGTEADLWNYDGGDGDDPDVVAPTATTGAMWARDENYDFRFPLAMGTSPAPTSTTVNPGETGGAEVVTITRANLPAETIDVSTGPVTSEDDGGSNLTSGPGNAGSDLTLQSEPLGEGTALNIMPPYRVGIWAKRTQRVYLVG